MTNGKKEEKTENPGKPPKRKRGGQLTYTTKLAESICTRLAKGETLRAICREKSMPSIVTVLSWLYNEDTKKEFQPMYDHAREQQAEVFFEQALEIADDASKDVSQIQYKNKKGQVKIMLSPNRVAVDRARLMVDTRKWFLARMHPKRFGEKLDVTSGGKEMKPARAATITYIVPPKPKSV